MNMDMLSRVFDIIQRTGGMEQIGQLMMIVYGVLCVFGLLNCILGYRILRFWMMIFGFLIGAGAGFAATYISGVQDKMIIAGAMAGFGIVLAIVSFLVYRAGIFVLGFGIGISLSIYLIHPTSSFSFFLCILIGVGLGALAMRYAKGVIIIGTSVLGGVLAGLSIAQMGGLAQFPYGIGMAVGIALLGMLIQFAINKDRDEEEESEDEDEPYEEERSRKRKNIPENRNHDFGYAPDDRGRKSAGGYRDDRTGNSDTEVRHSRKTSGRDGRYGDRSERRDSADERRRNRGEDSRTSAGRKAGGRRENPNSSSDSRRGGNSRNSSYSGRRSASDRTTSSERRRAGTSSKSYSPDPERGRNSYSARSRRYNRESGYEEIDMNEDYDPYDIPDREEAQNPNTYAEFEKQQQRRRQMDIENMADLDPEDYDEWEDK